MSSSHPWAADPIAAAILDYLAAWPRASDTADGIARFWLPDPLRSTSPEQVRHTLERLVAEGALIRMPTAGGEARYAAAPGPPVDC